MLISFEGNTAHCVGLDSARPRPSEDVVNAPSEQHVFSGRPWTPAEQAFTLDPLLTLHAVRVRTCLGMQVAKQASFPASRRRFRWRVLGMRVFRVGSRSVRPGSPLALRHNHSLRCLLSPVAVTETWELPTIGLPGFAATQAALIEPVTAAARGICDLLRPIATSFANPTVATNCAESGRPDVNRAFDSALPPGSSRVNRWYRRLSRERPASDGLGSSPTNLHSRGDETPSRYRVSTTPHSPASPVQRGQNRRGG